MCRGCGYQACLTHGGTPAPEVPHPSGAPPVWPLPVGACIGSGGFASVWEIPGGVIKVAHADHELARARMDKRNKGGEAAKACLAMVELKRRFGLTT